jgi:putative tricarboxylic transport membrane protein
MTGNSGASERGPSHVSVEAGVAIAITIFGIVTVFGSLRAGIGWGSEGPMAGFFPFYVGLLIVVSGLVNLYQAITGNFGGGMFASWSQLRQVLSVVIPTTIYVAAIPFIGIYVSSAVLIGFFMRWLGKYGWAIIAAVAIGLPVVIFVVFERWFLVPLPKGPLEAMLGY